MRDNRGRRLRIHVMLTSILKRYAGKRMAGYLMTVLSASHTCLNFFVLQNVVVMAFCFVLLHICGFNKLVNLLLKRFSIFSNTHKEKTYENKKN